MERLTFQENGKWRVRIGEMEYSGSLADRLAAYENIGMEPDALVAVLKDIETIAERMAQIGAQITSNANLEKNGLAATKTPRIESLSEEAIRNLPWRKHLELSTRAYNSLHHCGPNPYYPHEYKLEKLLETVGDVADLTKSEIRRIRNAGTQTFAEIAHALRKLGITHTEWYKFEK